MHSWFPENVSTYGGDVDGIFWFIFYIVTVWFFITEGLILYFIFRYRRKPGRSAVYATGDTWSQLAWVLVPLAIVVVLDLLIDIRGADVWAKVKGQRPPAELVVHGVGKQFNWEFIYPGPDGKFGSEDDLATDNELHVPVGKVIHVILSSKDVIHSFFLPHFRLKQDAVPGRQIPVWFEATKTGEFEIPCAELCGFGHSGMNGKLFVHSPEDFQKWNQEKWPVNK
ncbi:MAG: cytochrome c oxidase subunit II [Candidatus Binatia bacterium]